MLTSSLRRQRRSPNLLHLYAIEYGTPCIPEKNQNVQSRNDGEKRRSENFKNVLQRTECFYGAVHMISHPLITSVNVSFGILQFNGSRRKRRHGCHFFSIRNCLPSRCLYREGLGTSASPKLPLGTYKNKGGRPTHIFTTVPSLSPPFLIAFCFCPLLSSVFFLAFKGEEIACLGK